MWFLESVFFCCVKVSPKDQPPGAEALDNVENFKSEIGKTSDNKAYSDGFLDPHRNVDNLQGEMTPDKSQQVMEVA